MVKLFTHTDLDGTGCAVLSKIAFENNVDISYCDYDTIDKEVKEFISSKEILNYSTCFITDIKISDELAKEIDEKFKHFYLLDHHPTAMYLNKYNWCEVKEYLKYLNGNTIKTCGTELYYNWLFDHGFLKHKDNILNTFVEIVRDYDTYRWSTLGESGIICKKINDLMYLYGREEFINWCLTRIDNFSFPELSNDDKLLLSIKQREIDEYIDKKDKELIITTISGKTCGVVFADKYFSELGNKLCKMHPEIDFAAMIDMGDYTVSYRSIKDDIDLGKDIAMKFGGGGHPKAAGSTFSKDIAMDIINKIFIERKLKTYEWY